MDFIEQNGKKVTAELLKRRKRIKKKSQILPPDNSFERSEKNQELLRRASDYYDSLKDFRERAMRAFRYYRGKQWDDLIKNPDGYGMIKEEDYIKNQGRVPLKQNIIRQMTKNLIGQYRSNRDKTIITTRSKDNSRLSEMLTNALHYVLDSNETDQLDARSFEQFALSGAPVQKVTYKYMKSKDRELPYVKNVNIHRIFFNSDVEDVRLDDITLIGEVVDMAMDDLVHEFAKTRKDEEYLREYYGNLSDADFIESNGLSSDNLNVDLVSNTVNNKCRVIEIWHQECDWKMYCHDTLEGEYYISDKTESEIIYDNAERIRLGISAGMQEDEIPLIEYESKYEKEWVVTYLTPTGEELFSKKNQYTHQEHPYIMVLYPLVNGEVWGFVEDIIDQNRYINRLITLMDWIIGASAKGVLMVPADVVPDTMSPDEFAEEWRKENGVIFYQPNPKHRDVPKQISANSTNVGIKDLLQLQMKFAEDVGGVHGAIQGQGGAAGTPASKYMQETQNASLNNLDFMEFFKMFKQKRNNKIVKLIQQYFSQKTYLATSGAEYSDEAMLYDPDKAKDLAFDLTLTQSTDTPVFRQIMDDQLFQLLNGNLIDLKTYAELSNAPFNEKLLDKLQKKEDEVQEGVPQMPVQ